MSAQDELAHAVPADDGAGDGDAPAAAARTLDVASVDVDQLLARIRAVRARGARSGAVR